MASDELQRVLRPTSRCGGVGDLAIAFDLAAGAFAESLVLFGAGHLGRRTLAGLRKIGVEPLAFADNRASLRGCRIDGVSVLGPAEAIAKYSANSVFVVTIFNGAAARQQLKQLGAERVIPVGLLYWKHPRVFMPFGGLSDPQLVAAEADAITEAFGGWADESSRGEFLAQLKWRSTLDTGALPPHNDPSETYFPSDLVALSADEVFIDCGAFDGDTLRAFLAKSHARFARYVGFEPDPSNFRRLQACARDQGGDLDRRVTLHNAAVSSRTGKIAFSVHGDASSTVEAPEAAEEVPCMRLDDALLAAHPTYVKMDIEGAELEALAGGAKVLGRERPVLAICVYHKPADLWRIPLAIREICPDYSLHLRRYAEDCWELVCYAIPPGRGPIRTA